MPTKDFDNRFRGVLLGTAVGDSLGLAAEGISRESIKRLGWNNWRQRLILGKGMISDDTEHSLFVAQALLRHAEDPVRFQKSLAWKLRWWLLGIPAGIGFGTLRAVLKMWLGFPANCSGVYSAGNGPAMRCAIIGARFAGDVERLREFTKRSTELTHTDPKALTGALAISVTTQLAVTYDATQSFDALKLWQELERLSDENDWQQLVQTMKQSYEQRRTVQELAEEMGLNRGISGYVYDTVPIAIYSWLLNFGDFRKTLTDVLDCGGDTDTTGAIAGALAGALVGEQGIPSEWITGICEYPRTCNVLKEAGIRLVSQIDGSKMKPVRYFWPALVLRNLIFTLVVLSHGFLRLVPVVIRRRLIR